MTVSQPKQPKTLVWIIVLILLLAIVIGLYLAGKSYLPDRIQAAYQQQDCKSLNEWMGSATRFYPDLATSYPEFKNHVAECDLYLEAVAQFDARNWENAHAQFMRYESTYPAGIFSANVHNSHAVVLLSWADELLTQKQYPEALAELGQVATDFSDTEFVTQAKTKSAEVMFSWADELLAQKRYAEALARFNQVITDFTATESATKAKKQSAELLVAWGVDLRNLKDFSAAEAKFKELADWANANSSPEYIARAKVETALVYLEVAKTLQGQDEFDAALEQIQKAIQTDPMPDSAGGPATQARGLIPRLHTTWADALLTQQDIDGAIKQYQAAIDTSGLDYQPVAKDILANVYLKFANSLALKEDFLGALDQIALAKNSAGTGTLKETISNTERDVYNAFSTSSGEQAQAAIAEMVKTTCEGTDKKPSLPIFGTDTGSIKAVINGIDALLSQNLIARTPAELHYVVCAVETAKEHERFNATLITVMKGTSKEISRSYATFLRVQYIWELKIFKVGNNDVLAQTAFLGNAPDRFTFKRSGNIVFVTPGGEAFVILPLMGMVRPESIYGNKPDSDAAAKWIAGYIK